VLIDGKNVTTFLIDIAVPLIHNLSNIEAEEITNYENLAL
jgi:hypothetical protein